MIEVRAFDTVAVFETEKVIFCPLAKWMGHNNFCGIRSHPNLL